jgi:hypothetical protein
MNLFRFKSLLPLLAVFSIFTLQPQQAYCSDLSVTAANVAMSSNGTPIDGAIAGEAITAGKVVYLNTADNRYYLADCTVAAKSVVAGIAISSAPGAGQRFSICTEDPFFTPGATLSTAAPVYVLSTAGGIAPIADLAAADYCVVLFVTANSTGTKAAFRARGHASTTPVTS